MAKKPMTARERREHEALLLAVHSLILQFGRKGAWNALATKPDMLKELGISCLYANGVFPWRLAGNLVKEAIAANHQQLDPKLQEERIETYRARLEAISQDYEKHPGAAVSAMRTLFEVDGFLGRLQVQVGGQHLHQHLHMAGALSAVGIAKMLAGAPQSQLDALRELAQKALATQAAPALPAHVEAVEVDPDEQAEAEAAERDMERM